MERMRMIGNGNDGEAVLNGKEPHGGEFVE
jgi:hypothetical protein